MILSDRDIHNVITTGKSFLVNPFNEEMLQPNSIDLTLGRELKTLEGGYPLVRTVSPFVTIYFL